MTFKPNTVEARCPPFRRITPSQAKSDANWMAKFKTTFSSSKNPPVLRKPKKKP